MPLSIRPLDGSFAVEVSGLNLWETPSHDVVSELRRLWAKHGVLVFRRQSLSEEELVRFSAGFGNVEPHVRTDWSSRATREVTLVSNLRGPNGDVIGGLGSGELAWHTDQSFVAYPATGCLLYATELPPDNPDTSWANLRLAYAALPDPLREAVQGKVAGFSYAQRVSNYAPGNEPPTDIAARVPPVWHNLVNQDPRTGAHALYLDPGTMTGIRDMGDAEGRELLAALTAHATRPEFVYRHRWQIGDVVMWDNGYLLHRRESFANEGHRLMKRTIIRLAPERHICPGPA